MEEKNFFNSANAVNENVNVANATSENNNVVNATSNESKKKTAKKMKLNESIRKRVFKNGEYKTDKFKIEEIDETISILNGLRAAIIAFNEDKNTDKLVAYAKKLNMKESEIEKAFGRLLTNSIAA